MKSLLVGMAVLVGSAQVLGAQDARPVPGDSVLSADTTEIGVDITPSPTDSRSMLGGTGTAPVLKVPRGWRNVDELPPEGPLPGEKREASRGVSMRRLDGTRIWANAPAIVATDEAMVFVRPVLGRYLLGAEDTVVAGARPIKAGTSIRYAYVARPGMRVSGAWAREGTTTKWLPANGQYLFTSRTIITPIVSGEDQWLGRSYAQPYIADPVRPVRTVKKKVVRKTSARPAKKRTAKKATGEK